MTTVTVSRWIIGLTLTSTLMLGTGIPLIAVTATGSTETVDGTVVAVNTTSRVVVLDADGPESMRGRDIAVTVPVGRQITREKTVETLTALAPGQHVRAQISSVGHEARWVRVDD